MSDETKHRPVLVTGVVRAKKGGPITDLRLKGIGIKEKDWVVRKIKQGYDFVIKRGSAEPAQLIVKDTLVGDGGFRQDLVAVGLGELNNLSEVTEVTLDFNAEDGSVPV